MHPVRFLAAPTLLALSAALAAGPVTMASAASVSDPVTVSGPSPYASCTTGGVSGAVAGDVNYPNAEVEPYLAVNSTTIGTAQVNLIGVWQQDRWSTGAAHALMASYSVDAGKTWKETPLPFATCVDPESDLERASDPWISFGPDGTAYASALVLGTGGSTVQAVTSVDGGKTWANQRTVISDGSAFNDKESITADPTKPGTAYLVWDRADNAAHAPASSWFSRTTDGGHTWSAPKRIITRTWPDDFTVGNEVVADPRNGNLYTIYFSGVQRPHYKMTCHTIKNKKTGKRTNKCTKQRTVPRKPVTDFTLSFVKSMDGGATWSTPQVIVNLTDTQPPQFSEDVIRDGSPLPSAAVDPHTGTLYVGWVDGRWSKGQHEDVSLISSSDGGQQWTDPVQVDTAGDQPGFTMTTAVNSAGVVGVTYYQLVAGARSAASLPAEYWFRSSSDGGKTFGPATRIAGPFDMRGAPQSGGYFLGDYEGLAATGASFESFFVLPTGKSENPTDVYAANLVP